METLGMLGFIFGLCALGLVIELKLQLKESGVLKGKSKKSKKQLLKGNE
jgi:hypothetical protein